ncbi:DNA (cytosine-5)-methyltransferase DRM1A [Linum perenne]
MIGYGTPTDTPHITTRKLPESAIGPPYFYYENVALAPKGVWQTISRCLYDIEPEFVDSKFFCAAARKRGYVHNLPIEGRNHTRGGGISRTDRYKSLGNSFQVDTVAYHLSVLKKLFPEGLNMLSLFSGIGGAEVALHRLGVRLKNVVSVEISEVNRGIVKCWWDQTNQKGTLIEIANVQDVTAEKLEHLMSLVGGFDLVVGGSPCNNLAGSNRHHRDGLEGKESSLFYDYCRILDVVKSLSARYR